MQSLHNRNNLEGQSTQLLGYLDALFRRLVLPRVPAEDPTKDCSREEFRALILLRTRGRSIMSEFAGELGVPLSTATHTIDRLVRKGLVIRVRSEEDRRVVQVDLSPAGSELHRRMRAQHQAMARSWLAALTTSDRETFLQLMAKIAENAKPDPVLTAAAARRVSLGSETLR